MNLEVGTILTGKVTGITKFGAFVTVAPGKSGLVHISEIANTYVSDINEFLSEGQEVTVKIISVDNNGRLSLSIKATLPPPPPQAPRQAQTGGSRPAQTSGSRPAPTGGFRQPRPASTAPRRPQTTANVAAAPSADNSFEDKLKRFMQDSDTKIAGSRQYSDRKTNKRRGH